MRELRFNELGHPRNLRKAKKEIMRILEEVIFELSDDIEVKIEDYYSSPRTITITAFLYPGA